MTQRDFKRNNTNNVDNRLASKASQFYVRQLPGSNLWSGDGVDHINISRFGVTELGSALHPSSPLRFQHKDFGFFDHLAGFYYFIALGAKYPHFRTKEFNRASNMFHAKVMNNETIDPNEWQVYYLFLDAMWRQIRAYPKLMESLKASSLPFDCYNKRNIGQRRTGLNFLMIEGMERIRAFLKDPGDARYPEFGPFMMDYSHATIMNKYKREFLGIKEETVENNGEVRRNGLLEAAIEIRGRRRKKAKSEEPPFSLLPIQQLFLYQPVPEYLGYFGETLNDVSAFLPKFFALLPWPAEFATLDEENMVMALTIFRGWIMNVDAEKADLAEFVAMAEQTLTNIVELKDVPKDPSQMAGLYSSLTDDLRVFESQRQDILRAELADQQEDSQDAAKVSTEEAPGFVHATGMDKAVESTTAETLTEDPVKVAEAEAPEAPASDADRPIIGLDDGAVATTTEDHAEAATAVAEAAVVIDVMENLQA